MKACFLPLPLAVLLLGCTHLSPAMQKTEASHKSWSEVTANESAASTYGEPELIGTVTDKRLPEISGIAASQSNKGIFWVHNDSGDRARVYAIDQTGKFVAEYTVPGATNIDWEDISLWRKADGSSYLFLADIGDNDRKRDHLVIYRIKEPVINGSNGVTEPATAYPFTFADGKFDCEAMFINPTNGQIFLITKTLNQSCGVYRLPLNQKPGELVVAEKLKGRKVTSIEQLRMVTAADTSPDGLRLAIRTYFGGFELTRSKDSEFESFFDQHPAIINMPLLKQAEALCYSQDGESLITTSEKLPAPIYRITRR